MSVVPSIGEVYNSMLPHVPSVTSDTKIIIHYRDMHVKGNSMI